MTKISAKLSNGKNTQRLYFEPATNNPDKICVWSKTSAYGFYNLDRFGEKLNRDWVRKFAESSGLTVEF